MSTNIKFFLLCPVPNDQKPINEYINGKENLLTSWTTLSTKKYEKKIKTLFSIIFLFFSIVKFSTFQGIYYLSDWVFENCFFTMIFLIFFFLIILSRWVQIDYRFSQARLFYEEASWYDGQYWEKPLELIKNEKLISSQKIRPIIRRIQNSIIQLLFFAVLFFLLLQV